MNVLIDPYNPPQLKKVHLIRKPFLYWFPSFYKYIPTETYWYPGLALLLFAITGNFVKLKQSRFNTWLQKPFSWLPVSVLVAGVLCIYCTLTYSSPIDALWYIFDTKGQPIQLVLPLRLNDLSQMFFTIYTFHLLWKYRKQEPTTVTLLFLLLAYVPVFTYLGWHYCITGWFIRSAIYWPIIAKLIYLDTGKMRGRIRYGSLLQNNRLSI